MGIEREAPRAAAQPPRPSPMQKSSAALAQVFDEAGREPPSASSNGHITSAARDPERTSRPAPSHRQHVRLRHLIAFLGILWPVAMEDEFCVPWPIQETQILSLIYSRLPQLLIWACP